MTRTKLFPTWVGTLLISLVPMTRNRSPIRHTIISYIHIVQSTIPTSIPTQHSGHTRLHSNGQELFISSVQKANVFGTQFHPEKSGAAGLRLIDAWLRKPESAHTSSPGAIYAHSSSSPRVLIPKPEHRLTKRIVACMDVRANDDGDLVVTKGDQYDVPRENSHIHRLHRRRHNRWRCP